MTRTLMKCAGATPLLVCAALAFSTPVAAQTVHTMPRGDMEVRFGITCTVYYNNRGYRSHYDRGCDSAQLRRADAMIGDRPIGGGGIGGAIPQVIVGRNGQGEVVFPNTRCTAYYNERGVRLRNLAGCSPRQVLDADNAMARYRREQGHSPGFGGDDNFGGRPEVRSIANGRFLVVYNDGCSVTFSKNYNRIESTRPCTDRHRSRADDVMARYQRQQR